MQSGLNFNGYNQNINFRAQMQTAQTQTPVQNTSGAKTQPQMQTAEQQPALQNSGYISNDTFISSKASAPKASNNKLLIGALVAIAGTAVIALVCKIRGTNSSNAEKAAKQAAKAAGSAAAGKTEGAAEGTAEKPKGFFGTIRTKIKSFTEDVKKGYEDHTPVEDKPAAPPKPARTERKKSKKTRRSSGSSGSGAFTPAAVTARVNGALSSSFAKASDSVTRFAESASTFSKKGEKASRAAFATVTNDTKTKNWAERIFTDYSGETSDSISRAGIGKSNAFNRIDADSWLYNEGYSKNLATKTMHAKRRIGVTADEITVALDSAKTKGGASSAGRLFRVDKTTGGVVEYSGYKTFQDGSIKYKSSMRFTRGASAPDAFVEGYEKFADGTTKISRKIETSGSCISDSEKLVMFADGSETCSRAIVCDKTSGDIMHYVEGKKLASDGAVEYAKEFNRLFGEYTYGEGVKILADGTETAAKKMQLTPDNKLLSCSENYKKTAAGNITADKMVEYAPDGTLKFYYEGYKKTAAGGTTWSFRARFDGTKWVKA